MRAPLAILVPTRAESAGLAGLAIEASESERERARPSESERDQARASDSVSRQLRFILRPPSAFKIEDKKIVKMLSFILRPPSAFKMENRKWTIAGWLAGWLCISEFYTVETSGVYASKLCPVSLEIVSSLWIEAKFCK